ncbi:tetratricopeptide repeat protein [Ancylomarina euxinus]|uniref:Tetratricopeptide repeat protein n=2 Tax=Ancylomarina euxinus TaxID=2283627 RepID=A0A425Y1W8_9BACT|nr:tetratricopeptide repeat protein [Ancylomarina euxinus]
MLSLPACKTISQVQFQALEAPQVVLPSDVSRIAFVDRNQYFPSDSVMHYYSVTSVSIKDTIDHTQNMSLNCYQGFVENLSEFWSQDSIPFIRLPKKIMPDTTRHFAPLSWETVDSICIASQSDVLVVLEDIKAFNKHDIVEGDAYWAFTEVNYYGRWRIYDPLYKKFYDERLLVDSLFMETSDASFNKLVSEKLPSREQMLNDASYELGRTYVDLISPRWVDVSRDYFVSGDKRLSAALYFMNKNEFDSAINIWKSLISENDLKLAGRAAYNLAVVHEMRGDLKNAMGWIRKSIYFYQKMKNRSGEYKEIEAYALVLNSRWDNGKKIKRFFGEGE